MIPFPYTASVWAHLRIWGSLSSVAEAAGILRCGFSVIWWVVPDVVLSESRFGRLEPRTWCGFHSVKDAFCCLCLTYQNVGWLNSLVMCIVVRIIMVVFLSLQEDDEKKEPEEPEHSRKLFIGGLNYQTTNESLKTYFEKWGDIMDVAVMKDPKTNKYVLVVTQINLMTVGNICSQSRDKQKITT